MNRMPPPTILSGAVVSVAVGFEPGLATVVEAAQLGLGVPAELSRAVAKRQAEFVAGRYCAREALRALGVEKAAAPGVRSDRGPDWPAGVVGSITHSGGYVWAAVAWAAARRGIGIDTETIPDAVTADEIRPVVLNADEAAILDRAVVPRWGAAAAVGLALSVKESLYKCLSGSAFPSLEFGDAVLSAIDPDRGRFWIRLLRDVSKALSAGYEWEGRFTVVPPHIHTAIEWLSAPRGANVAERR